MQYIFSSSFNNIFFFSVFCGQMMIIIRFHDFGYDLRRALLHLLQLCNDSKMLHLDRSEAWGMNASRCCLELCDERTRIVCMLVSLKAGTYHGIVSLKVVKGYKASKVSSVCQYFADT